MQMVMLGWEPRVGRMMMASKSLHPGKANARGGDTFSVALGIDEKSQLGVFSSTVWASRRNQH